MAVFYITEDEFVSSYGKEIRIPVTKKHIRWLMFKNKVGGDKFVPKFALRFIEDHFNNGTPIPSDIGEFRFKKYQKLAIGKGDPLVWEYYRFESISVEYGYFVIKYSDYGNTTQGSGD